MSFISFYWFTYQIMTYIEYVQELYFYVSRGAFVLEISIKGPNTHVHFDKGKGPKQKSPWSLTPAWTMQGL